MPQASRPQHLTDAGFHRVSKLEFAAGWVPGHVERPAPTSSSTVLGPIQALEQVILQALAETPCVLGFSGGRDSSALLAVAVRIARREQLDMPIVVTNRYPGVAEADEAEWQELVIRHLGVDDWVRRDVTDELDLLGDAARASVLRHGPLWPATVHNREPSIAIARGGCYIDGEGGDEILGEFRITPLTQLVRRQRGLDRDAIRKIGYSFAPTVFRRRVETGRMRTYWDRPWLRQRVADWYVRTATDDEARRPLGYPAAVWRIANRRAVQVAMHNLDVVGRTLGVRYVHPLYDPAFLDALGRFGGKLGHSSRTATMRALFSEMLPDKLLARDTKAYFNTAFIGASSREFLDSWDGTGLDEDLIDVEALRDAWSLPRIHAGTFQLMHAAWLASQPVPTRTDPPSP
jgi:hypothetical protein